MQVHQRGRALAGWCQGHPALQGESIPVPRSSRTYEDRGPKQLTFVHEDGHWRIAREEMLQSTLLAADADRERPPLERFAFAEHLDGVAYLVLQRAPPEWIGSEPRLVVDDYPIAARADVSPAVPAELRAWVGTRVRLLGPGIVCDASVESLEVLGIVDADDSYYLWDEAGAPPERIARAHVAKAAMTVGGPVLAARVDRPCETEALFGQRADQLLPRVLQQLDLADGAGGEAVADGESSISTSTAASKSSPVAARAPCP